MTNLINGVRSKSNVKKEVGIEKRLQGIIDSIDLINMDYEFNKKLLEIEYNFLSKYIEISKNNFDNDRLKKIRRLINKFIDLNNNKKLSRSTVTNLLDIYITNYLNK